MGRRGVRPKCSEAGCGLESMSKGLCAKHYARKRRAEKGAQPRDLPAGEHSTVDFIQTIAKQEELKATFGEKFNTSAFLRRAWDTQFALEKAKLPKP